MRPVLWSVTAATGTYGGLTALWVADAPPYDEEAERVRRLLWRDCL